jgi:tRNA (cytidine/uridine-2'-O-)-methyltransferase
MMLGSQGVRAMHVVLFQPQIPQNAGNIARTCAVTGCQLTLISPLGFSTGSRQLRRAGLDYWDEVSVTTTDDWKGVFASAKRKPFFFSSKGTTRFDEVTYAPDDFLVFGSETTGLPEEIMEEYDDRLIQIPMRENVRCLNLATSVGIAVYEAWRQLGYKWY